MYDSNLLSYLLLPSFFPNSLVFLFCINVMAAIEKKSVQVKYLSKIHLFFGIVV